MIDLDETISFIPDLSLQQPDEYIYLEKKAIRGIAEGDALIFDTKSYFVDEKVSSYSAVIDLACNNKSNPEIAIGYKSPEFELLEIPRNNSISIPDDQFKEVVLWLTKDLFSASSINLINDQEVTQFNSIKNSWNVTALGFSKEDNNGSLRIENAKINFVDMMEEVDTNVGVNDELFVYVFGHGRDGNEHKTYITIAKPIFPNRFIKMDDYKTAVSDITDGGTYVFLWVKACYGFDNWNSSDHNNH